MDDWGFGGQDDELQPEQEPKQQRQQPTEPNTTVRNLKVPPPEHFDGQAEHWEHWSYLFQAYMQLHDNRATEPMDAAALRTEVITNSQLPATKQRFRADLHYM